MTRGNQREQDRLKAQKKVAAQKKSKESGASLAKRKEADAEILRQKQKVHISYLCGYGAGNIYRRDRYRKRKKNEGRQRRPGRNDLSSGPAPIRRHIPFSLASAVSKTAWGVTGGDGDGGRGERRGAESDGRDLDVFWKD
ncbi:hypothetical protein BDM02DRAFT_3258750 [Thelephora ganbajun]|uniref:Uncharacterized protein n=1 Tax=Thelephora ganbajun TaxID=370292 RepID=A0ACB6ZQD6_THEGA|nr:hypothetical protein BDM02DRAFT_3258750 [Thelephora ganbajun]